MKKLILPGGIARLLTAEAGFSHRAGVSLRIADTNAAALAQHRADPADLLVGALDDAGLSGAELCRSIRAEESLRHVSLLLAGPDGDERRRRALACGANDLLGLPASAAEISRKLAPLLLISERRGYRVLMRLIVEAAAGGERFFAVSHNLSATGVLLETAHGLAPGDRLALSFFLPEGHRIAAGAEVVRTAPPEGGPPRYGLRFTELGGPEREFLEQFVHRQQAQAAGAAPQRPPSGI